MQLGGRSGGTQHAGGGARSLEKRKTDKREACGGCGGKVGGSNDGGPLRFSNLSNAQLDKPALRSMVHEIRRKLVTPPLSTILVLTSSDSWTRGQSGNVYGAN